MSERLYEVSIAPCWPIDRAENGMKRNRLGFRECWPNPIKNQSVAGGSPMDVSVDVVLP